MYAAYFLTLIGVVFLANFLFARDKNGSVKALVLKTCTSLLFISVGITALNANFSSTSLAIIFPSLLIIVGLMLGLVGDVFLDLKIFFKGISSTYPPAVKESDTVTYFGMVAFAIGHVFYIAACSLLYTISSMHLVWLVLVQFF